MKTKEEVLHFLQQNNCNQELINDFKDGDGYDDIADCYKYNGLEATEFALKQKQVKRGYYVYWIAKSYKQYGVKFTELALQQDKAKNANYVYWIAKSYKQYGVKFTELALKQDKAKNAWDVCCIAKEMFNEGKKD